MSQRAVICAAYRAPIGSFQGGLASVRAPQLGAVVTKAILERSGVDKEKIDEAIFGNVCQAGLQQNPARQAAIYAGIPAEVSAMTINKVCGSGMKSVALAAQAIKAGDIDCAMTGGFENMSQVPYALLKARDGLRLGHGQVTDLLVHDGLWDIFYDFHMGRTGESVSSCPSVTREEQDAFAAESHRRALVAWEAGKFDREVVPVEVPHPK